MSRTSVKLNCKNPAEAENTIQSILASSGYNLKQDNDESYYQNGSGFLAAPKFIAYSFNGNELTLEAWVRNFVIGGESSLDGFVGIIPKKNCQKVFDAIVASIDAEAGSLQMDVSKPDERTFLQKRLYKYDAATNELRISKFKVITWAWFFLMFIWAMMMRTTVDISFVGNLFVSIIFALMFTIPVFVIGYIITYFLDKRAKNQAFNEANR